MADGDGALRPVRGIDRCPEAAAAGGQPCRLVRHDWRPRKTGPGYPLGVLRCRVHGRYFTVYPPGFTPFGRQRTAPAERPKAAVRQEASELWGGTMLEAATQAAAGETGVRDAGFEQGPPKPRHSTMRRRVASAARLLGLSAEIDTRRAELVAQALELAGLDHTQARRAFAQAKGLRERGVAIVSVLERMPLAGALERRLLCAGSLVGLWGPPAVWDARTSRPVFRPCGTSPAGSPRSPP